jgi:hypothetical protein
MELEAVGTEDCEEGDTGAAGSCAKSGKVASAMAISKQHFHTMCLIPFFCSVRLWNERIVANLGSGRLLVRIFSGNPGLGRAKLYARHLLSARLEILIDEIEKFDTVIIQKTRAVV